jgi:hypothetical protein
MTRKAGMHGWKRHWPRLLFLIPLVAMLWVPSYNRLAPEFAGIPFFYWYQLLWILVGAAIVALVYTFEIKLGRARKKDGGEIDTTGLPGDVL